MSVYAVNTGGTATSYTNLGMTAGIRHVHRIRAINPAVGSSARSMRVNVDP